MNSPADALAMTISVRSLAVIAALGAVALVAVVVVSRGTDTEPEPGEAAALEIFHATGARWPEEIANPPEEPGGRRLLGFGPAPETPEQRLRRALVEGRFERAFRDLERAVRSEPRTLALRDALSAAYLARGLGLKDGSEGDPGDLVRALERIGPDPADLSSLFNRAVALEALYCLRTAAETWERYLERDPGSEWGTMAAERLEAARERLASLDPRSIENQPVGPPGTATGPPGLAQVRAGFEALRQGPEVALEHFLRALEQGAEEDEALRWWVEVGIARVEHLRQDLAAADARARQALEVARRIGDPRLEVEALWTLESVGLGGLSLEDSLRYARNRYDLGEREGLADVRTSAAFKLSRVLDELGRPAEAWRYRVESFRGYEALGWGEHLAVAIGNSAFALARQERYLAAADFASEVIARDREVGGPKEAENLVDGLWIRASSRARIGDTDGALADVAEAGRWLPRIESESYRDRYWRDLRVVEGQVFQVSDPERAVEAFTGYLDRLEALDYEYGQAEIFLERGRALRRLGRGSEALRDLDTAYRIVLGQRGRIADLPFRVSYLDLRTGLADELVSLASEIADPDASLRTADSAKGLLFRDPEGEFTRRGPVASVPGDPDELTVSFWVLPEETLIWIRTAGAEVSLRRVDLGREELAATLDRLAEGLQSGDASGPTVVAAASDAFDALLGPIRQELAEARRLTIVPDRFTRGVPWAALRDSRTGERVLDRFIVTLRPSVAGSSRSGPSAPAISERLVALADPAVGGSWSPLPAARREVTGLADRFEDATVLVGKEATRERFVGELRGATVAHVAAHFEADEDPWETRIVLASAAGEAVGGGISAREIAGLDGSSLRLVVLSGCASGREGRPSLEGTYSMAGAFLAAGADEVIATLWPVDDRTTADLMAELYLRLLDGMETAEALREAQRAVAAADDTRTDWAAFQVITAADS